MARTREARVEPDAFSSLNGAGLIAVDGKD